MLQHVMCAAAELPLTLTQGGLDVHLFGPRLQQVVTSLRAKALLGRHPRALATTTAAAAALSARSGGGPSSSELLYYTGASDSAARGVSLRCIDPEQFVITDEASGRVLEVIEGRKAFYQVYGE